MILCSKMIVMSEKKMTSLLLYLFCLLNKKKHYTTSLLRESIKQSCKEEKGCSKFGLSSWKFYCYFPQQARNMSVSFFSQQFQNKSIKTKEGQFSWNRSCWKKNRRKLYQLLNIFFLSLSDKEFFSFWKMSEKCMLLTGVSSFELQLQKTLQNKCIVGGKDFAKPASYLIIDFTRTIIHFSLTSSVSELRSSFDITLSLWYFMLLQIHTTIVNSIINQIDWLSNI